MRKILSSSIITFFAPLAALAQSDVEVPKDEVPQSIEEFYQLVCSASNWVFAFVLIIAVIILLFGAVSFFTARGNEDQVGDARRYITYALVGVAVAILARALIFVVASFIGISDPGATLFDC